MSDKKRLIWIDSLRAHDTSSIRTCHSIFSGRCLFPKPLVESHLFIPHASLHGYQWLVRIFHHFKSHQRRIIVQTKIQPIDGLVPSWSLLRYVISANYSIENLSRIIIAPDSYFWFLWVLFWIKIIFILNQKVAEKYHMDEIIPIGITCMVLLGIMVGLNLRVFGFQFLAYYYLFYFLGYAMRRFNKLQLTNKPSMICLGLLWAVLAWFWNMHELPAWMPRIPHCPTSLLQYAYRGVTAMLAVLVIVGAARKVLDSSGRFNKFIQEVGILSLGIYTCHLTLMYYIVKSLRFIVPSNSEKILIILGFTICGLLSWVIVNMLKKNKMTARFFLGK